MISFPAQLIPSALHTFVKRFKPQLNRYSLRVNRFQVLLIIGSCCGSFTADTVSTKSIRLIRSLFPPLQAQHRNIVKLGSLSHKPVYIRLDFQEQMFRRGIRHTV